jgi:aspartyl-tRNA(Asn)/glutamyl-tRNA(Gln) amidotransferase subunit C
MVRSCRNSEARWWPIGPQAYLAIRIRLRFHSKAMALTIEEVRKIATLARLRFTPEEEGRFAAQLGQIVGYIDQLQSFAGSADARASTGLPEGEDVVVPGLPREKFLANAPEQRDGFLVVAEVKAAEAEGS